MGQAGANGWQTGLALMRVVSSRDMCGSPSFNSWLRGHMQCVCVEGMPSPLAP